MSTGYIPAWYDATQTGHALLKLCKLIVSQMTMRGSTNDGFYLYLKGQTTGQVYGPIPATKYLDGSYNVTFQFTKVQAYTINIKLGSNDIVGSPITNINVFASNV